MQIKILGSGCANCVNLEKNTRKALATLGLDAEIVKVTEYADIAANGVMRTPGLVIDEVVVLSGKVPTAATVAELISANR